MLPYLSQWIWDTETTTPTTEKEKEGRVLEGFRMRKEDDWVLIDRSHSPVSSLSDLVSDSEESWVVAPPSCLSREDPASEAGSLEDLLIEHPSMSVYQNRPGSSADSVSQGGHQNVLSPIPTVPSRLQVARRQRRQPGYEAALASHTVVTRSSAQSKGKETAAKVPKLTRGSLECHNKARNGPRRKVNKARRQQCRVFQPMARRH